MKIFPLGAVLFPGLPLPLHIFEERYKQQISDCIENDEPFGVVYADEIRMHEVGCTARIEDIVKRYDDGKLDIITRGERKFRILEVEERKPIVIATVSYITEDPLVENDKIQRLLSQTIKQLGRLASITGSEINLEALSEMDPEKVSYLVAGLDAFSPEEKQFFLELPSTSQRLLACVQSLVTVVHTYDIGKEARELLPEGRLLHRLN